MVLASILFGNVIHSKLGLTEETMCAIKAESLHTTRIEGRALQKYLPVAWKVTHYWLVRTAFSNSHQSLGFQDSEQGKRERGHDEEKKEVGRLISCSPSTPREKSKCNKRKLTRSSVCFKTEHGCRSRQRSGNDCAVLQNIFLKNRDVHAQASFPCEWHKTIFY